MTDKVKFHLLIKHIVVNFFFSVGEYMDPVTDTELSELADYMPPKSHERIALILGMGREVVPNLRGEHRDNMHGISLGLLKKWTNIHHQPGNRVVSLRVHVSTDGGTPDFNAYCQACFDLQGNGDPLDIL